MKGFWIPECKAEPVQLLFLFLASGNTYETIRAGWFHRFSAVHSFIQDEEKMTFVFEVFVKCFELNGTHSMSINFMLAALRTPPINPKENKKKKTAKKKKKESHYFKWWSIGMSRFLEKKYYLIDFFQFKDYRLLRWRFFFQNTF